MQESNIRRSCNNSEDARRGCHAKSTFHCYVQSRPIISVRGRRVSDRHSTMYKPCRTVSNRVGPCQTHVKPCQIVLDRVKSVSDRVWVKFDPAGVKGLKSLCYPVFGFSSAHRLRIIGHLLYKPCTTIVL